MDNISNLADGIQKILESYKKNEYPESSLTPTQITFGNAIRNVLQELLNEDDFLNEDFICLSVLMKHFQKHCVGIENKKSTPQDIRYDFKTLEEYTNYEIKLSRAISNAFDDSTSTYFISSLYDAEDIINKVDKFFAGNAYLIFLRSCNVMDLKTGRTRTIALHSYCTDKTTNFPGRNTIDFRVGNVVEKTITLFPIDANKLEKKINSLIRNYSDSKISVKLKNG